ncbi:hypothetical protein [Streptomyces sp. NPDC005760]|uniref:hypothetical protein n=1 Tax=Streptomyces sp. NPDC005760 TaxID=3156718 RepID=UPI0033E33DBB
MRRPLTHHEKTTGTPRLTAPCIRTRLRTAPGAAIWPAPPTTLTLAPLPVTAALTLRRADPARALREGGE